MKVAELIVELQKLEPEAEIMTWQDSPMKFTDITRVRNVTVVPEEPTYAVGDQTIDHPR